MKQTTGAGHDAASPLRSGHATFAVETVAGKSAVTAARSVSPLRLLVPRPRGRSVWVYTSSFGGGLVAGDQTQLDFHLSNGTRCFVGTQASTKVYRNPQDAPCSHHTRAIIGPDALLVFAPDPVQPFADSSYTQRQEFRLDRGASLVLLDWFTAGRTARGERWQFRRFRSRNAVFGAQSSAAPDAPAPAPAPVPAPLPGELIFLDSLALDAEDGSIASPHRTGRYNCFATLVLLGPAVSAGSAAILSALQKQPVERQASLLGAASPVRDGVVLRLAGRDVEAVATELRQHLRFLVDLLGDDPWARKW